MKQTINEEKNLLFPTISIIQKDRRFVCSGYALADEIADVVQAYRDVAEYFCAHIDTPELEINERVAAEIIVMLVTMDYPSIKAFWSVRRIMNEAEPEAPVFEKYHRCRVRFLDIVISLNETNPPSEFIPVIPGRCRSPAVSEVSQVINPV